MYSASVTFHVLAAIFWLGGMFFLGIVGAPALAGLDPDLRRRLFKEIGLRFRGPGWVAISVLLMTGLVNLHFRGILVPALHGGRDFWLTPIGQILAGSSVWCSPWLRLELCTTFGWVRSPVSSTPVRKSISGFGSS
jgi:putative copper export protein